MMPLNFEVECEQCKITYHATVIDLLLQRIRCPICGDDVIRFRMFGRPQ